MLSPHKRGLLSLAALASILCLDIAAPAQTFSVLHNFTGAANDGATPYSSFIASGSTLYSMTSFGGKGSGNIFSFNTGTNALTSLYSFAGNNTDGVSPEGGFLQSGNILYGTTTQGGTTGDGTIFSFNTTTGDESLLYSFPGGSGGQYPDEAILSLGSLFYGTTDLGGSGNGGTIFSFNPATNTTTILHTFTGGANDGLNSTYGVLVPSGSTLYGVSSEGGASNDGAIYSFNTTNNHLTVLHSFTGSGGYYPEGGVTLSGNILYGTTSGGGTPFDGLLYSYNLSTGTYTILHSFDGNDGQLPTGELLQSGSTLYGVTEYGGADDDGAIYSFNLSTDQFNLIHSFDGADGANPWQNSLVLANNTIYGMTSDGGTDSDGVIFSVALPEPATLGILAICLPALVCRPRRTKIVSMRNVLN